MTTPSRRSSSVYPLTFAQGGHARILPPRDVRFLIISPTVGSSGFRCTLSAAPLRTQSTAELVRNTVTSSPELIAPLAMLQATDIFSSSNPQAITTTKCFFSGTSTSLVKFENIMLFVVIIYKIVKGISAISMDSFIPASTPSS